MNKKKQAKNFKKFIKKHTYILIQTHDYPDPDAIAAAYGIHTLIKNWGCKSTIIYHGEITRAITNEMIKVLQIPLAHASTYHTKNNDQILVVDGRIDNENITTLEAVYIGTIDHHTGKTKHTEEPYSDIRPNYGSTSTIIAEYFQYLSVQLPSNVATALSVGLNTDTFRLLRNISNNDLEIYPYLYSHSDKNYLQYVLLNNIEINDLDYFKQAINNLKTEKRFGITDLGKTDNATLLAIICDFMLSLQELDVTLTIAQTEKALYLSIRSERPDLPAVYTIKKIVANYGNGGGHKTMAAGTIPITKENNIEFLKKTITERFFACQPENHKKPDYSANFNKL